VAFRPIVEPLQATLRDLLTDPGDFFYSGGSFAGLAVGFPHCLGGWRPLKIAYLYPYSMAWNLDEMGQDRDEMA